MFHAVYMSQGTIAGDYFFDFVSAFVEIIIFSRRFHMAVSKRKDRREGKHGQGSYKKKSGPKKTPKGKQDYAAKWQRKCALETANWKLKIPKLIASLALSSGESMDGGEARMALRVTCQVIEEANLKFDPASGKIPGLHACYERAATLTGSTPSTLKRLFDSLLESDGATYKISDTSKRGRGSDSVDKASLYKINPGQVEAIKAFIAYSNSSKGAAKVPANVPRPARTRTHSPPLPLPSS